MSNKKSASYAPNGFLIPNIIIDDLMYLLTPEEFRVALALLRHNPRYLRCEEISKMTGMSLYDVTVAARYLVVVRIALQNNDTITISDLQNVDMNLLQSRSLSKE